MQKYKKTDNTSYALGTELTFELLKQHPDRVNCVYIHSKQKDNEVFREIQKLCKDNKIEMVYSDKAFNILSDKENCYIIGSFRKYESSIDPKANHVVLVSPSNTGNLGTIIRTSVGFGLNNIAIIRPAVDIYDPRVIRASMGSFFELNFQYFDSFEEYLQLADKRNIYPFMLDGAKRLDVIDIPEHYSIVFGNEATGLPSQYQNYGQSILIKHLNTIDSLNLCNAVSIALYQFTKGKL